MKLAEGGFDDFVLITGEGLTRILSCIDKYEPALRPRFVEGLGKLRTITRGPKPARALRALGLKPGIEATEPTTDGVIRSLSAHPLEGRRVAVQLYGNDPNLTLMRFLRDRRAIITTVAPYVYGNAADDATVHALLERMAAGEVDAIAFTSKLQIERLVTQHPAPLVRRALTRTKIAAVGPDRRRGHSRRRLRSGLEPRALLVHEAAGGRAQRAVGREERQGPLRPAKWGHSPFPSKRGRTS